MTIFGCFLILIGTIALETASSFESKAVRAGESKDVRGETKNRFLYWLVVLLSPALIVAGTWFTIYDGQIESEHLKGQVTSVSNQLVLVQRTLNTTSNQLVLVQGKLDAASNESALTKLEYEQQFAALQQKVGAAVTQDLKKINEGKMRALQNEVTLFGADLAKQDWSAAKQGYSTIKQQKAESKSEQDKVAAQRLVDLNNHAYQIIDFSVSYLKGLVRSASEQTKANVTIDIPDVPSNLISNSLTGTIKFQGKAIWSVNASYRHDSSQQVNLSIGFTDSDGDSAGSLLICVDERQMVFGISYQPTVPSRDLNSINGNFDFDAHEAPIVKALRSVVEAQTILATPAPTSP